jgi:hypothetical protein
MRQEFAIFLPSLQPSGHLCQSFRSASLDSFAFSLQTDRKVLWEIFTADNSALLTQTATQTVPALHFCKRNASKKANRLTHAPNTDFLLSASPFVA